MRFIVRALAFWLVCSCVASARAEDAATPADVIGELFTRVQRERVYPDSKTFVDTVPMRPPAMLLAEYRSASQPPDFDLRAFVGARFAITPPCAATPRSSSRTRA